MMNHHPVELASHLKVTVPTIYNWRSGRHTPPPGIPDAIKAVEKGLSPVSVPVAMGLVRTMGVPRQQVYNWRKAGQPPHSYLLACAAALDHGIWG